MSYIWDKVLEPASAVLTTPMPGEDDSEKTVLDEMFDDGLPASSSVRYRQDLAGAHRYPFLCYNWAIHRIKNDLVKNQPFPREPEEGTTDYDAAEMGKQLNALGLVACDDNDENRMVLLWAIKNDDEKSKIGHIQVRWTDSKGVKYWESKLSQAQWVICHDELLIAKFIADGSGERLVRAVKGKRYYKRTWSVSKYTDPCFI